MISRLLLLNWPSLLCCSPSMAKTAQKAVEISLLVLAEGSYKCRFCRFSWKLGSFRSGCAFLLDPNSCGSAVCSAVSSLQMHLWILAAASVSQRNKNKNISGSLKDWSMSQGQSRFMMRGGWLPHTSTSPHTWKYLSSSGKVSEIPIFHGRTNMVNLGVQANTVILKLCWNILM